MQYIIGLAVIIVAIVLLAKYWYIPVTILAIWGLVRLIRHVRMVRYFRSEDFQAHLDTISAVISEHNDIAEYAKSIRDDGQFQIGTSTTGVNSDLASFENTSKQNYQRNRNTANFQASNVHNCSLQVVRNASSDPLKYLTKYFNIKTTEDSLADVEALGESISRLENAVDNLRQRESDITESFAPPTFIRKHYMKEFMDRVGVELAPIEIPYPEYVFEYVSAGGNSAQKTTIKLNSTTIDRLIEFMSEKIRFRNSAAGQRALMTAALRESIKERDNYACKYCGAALTDEPHLLLEIDHIVPVSKGGLSIEDNLQTLCWRCNRSKSDKLPA